MNTSSIILTIGAIAVLGGGVWWYTQRAVTDDLNGGPSSVSCLPASQLPVSTTIEYRDSAFFAAGAEEPSDTFCVRKGAAVTFTGANLWIASDPHPIHSDVPGFDARGVKETFTFTFDRVGELGFHNHVRASDTGTLIVVE